MCDGKLGRSRLEGGSRWPRVFRILSRERCFGRAREDEHTTEFSRNYYTGPFFGRLSSFSCGGGGGSFCFGLVADEEFAPRFLWRKRGWRSANLR